ncbi:MAG TPA: DNA primase [Thermoguttaceae bacterium]|nr:DNA primase [Thermoguttaceae bacterium]
MVSGGFSLDTKEQVRQAIDIVELVGSYVALRRQGRGYVALCPWHDDSRPSLQVNPERQSFKCWVCDVGGDVFSFVMKMENVEFREALEMLAERAGINLAPRPREQAAPDSPEAKARDKKTLYRAMAWAETQYHRCLVNGPEAEPARQYLKSRGINSQSIERFHLGFAPGSSDWILRQAQGGTAPRQVLEAIGLLVSRTDGSQYERFRGRLLFSIRDAQSRPVGLGGRVLPEVDCGNPQAKYVNSPETLLFTKSHLLYGLDLAKEALRREKDKAGRTALVMEGYTDVIMAHQYGFDNAVAVLGTALGPNHVQILKRFADRVVLVLDGDEAGQKRTAEVLDLFVAQEVDLYVLTLPESSDPCDFLAEHGAEGFRELLAREAVDAVEHALRTVTRGVDLAGDVHGATQALERMVGLLAKAPRPSGLRRFREEKILSRLATRFAVGEGDIRARLVQLRRTQQKPVYAGQAESVPREAPIRLEELHHRAPSECELLELVVAFPDLLAEAREVFPVEAITEAPLRRIYETSCRLADEGQRPGFDRLMLEFDEPVVKGLLVELEQSPRVAEVADPVVLLKELIENHKRMELRKRHPSQLAALKDQGLNESQKNELLRSVMEELRARHGISDPTDG